MVEIIYVQVPGGLSVNIMMNLESKALHLQYIKTTQNLSIIIQ